MRVRIGEVDWVARYAELVSAPDASRSARPDDRWRDRAARFDRMSRTELGGGATIEGLASLVRAGDVVLDIGAGTGRHAVPLAARAARIVALEPSAAMRERLSARLSEDAISNVDVVDGEWPATRVSVVDVAYSAHVVYGVTNLPAFLEAMTAVSRRACALLLKLRAPSDALAEVYEAVHGAARPRKPAALEAFAVLHQLGLAASLTVVEGSERPLAFRNEPDDLREVALRLGLGPDDDGLARVRAALERVRPAREGVWDVGTAGPTALISWLAGAERG